MAIKFALRIIGKYVELLEAGNQTNQEIKIGYIESIKIMKVLLKITRVCSEKADQEILEASNNERLLFEMVKAYSNKCQNRLYQMSQNVLNNINQVNQIKTNSNKMKIDFNKLNRNEAPKCSEELDFSELLPRKDSTPYSNTTEANSVDQSFEEDFDI